MSEARSRTPGTPTKKRTRREQLVHDEIPTRDITKSKSVGGTPQTRRLIQNSAVRRSCPELSKVKKPQSHFRRHSENRAFVVQPIPRDETERGKRSLSQGNLVDPNITNNSITSSDVGTRLSTCTKNNLSKGIYKMWKRGQLCDIIINAGGTQFHVHRLVMAANCENFATSKQTIYQYDVPNVRAEVMDQVLDFFYTSNLTITSENVEEVLEISHNLGAKQLLDMCINFLKKVNLKNAVRNRAVAQRFGLNGVIAAIDKYVHEHFSALITTSSFLESDFNYIYDIISSDILTKPNELQIFQACAKWIDYKRRERIKYTVPLISLIRFGLIPASEIVAKIEPVTFIFEIPECKDMLYSAFRHHALFEESRAPSRGTASSKSGSKISKNLQRINTRLTGKSVNVAHVEHEMESSDSATESSYTVTSMEYEVQTSHSVDKVPRTEQTARDESKSKFYSDIIDELQRSTVAAQKEQHHTQTAGDVSDISKTSSAADRNIEIESSQSVKILTETFSNVAINNKKVSRKDSAQSVDYFESANNENKHSTLKKKVKSYDDLHEHDHTEYRKAQHRADDYRSPPCAKKFVSPDRRQRQDTHIDKSHTSAAVIEHPSRTSGALRTHKRIPQVPGNFMELSPIRSEPTSDLPPQPIPHSIMIVGGASAYDNNSFNDCVNNSVQQYDPDLNTWHLRSKLPVPVHYSGVSLLDGYLYVIGGRLLKDSGFVPIKDCYRYDVVNDHWEKIASLRTARCRHAVVILNRAIYVIGGEDCIGMSCNTIEIYNKMSSSWGFASPMHEARVDAAAVAHRGRLYVAGGMMDIDDKLILNTMEVYDPRTQEWSFKYPLPLAVCSSSMVEIDGVLYLVGGYVMRDGEPLSLDSIFRYLDETDSWEGYKTLHVPRHDAVTAVLDSKLYIIGGESSAAMGHALSNVECIDVKTDKHVAGIAPLLTPAYGISGCVLTN